MIRKSPSIAFPVFLLLAILAGARSITHGQDATPPAPSPAASPAAPAPVASPAAPAPAASPAAPAPAASPAAPAPAASPAAARPKLTLADLEDAFLDVADLVRPGVVAIEAKHEWAGSSEHSQTTGSDVELLGNVGFSGVVWDDEGTIVAIGRDLESATEISVSPFEGEAVKARFLGLDDETGVAVLKVEGDRKGLHVLEHGKTESLRAGAFCVAVGNPAGLRHSVAFGHIAAVGRTVKRGLFVTKDAIQVTLSVNPGDPGGLLADSRGRMVGVLTSALRRPETLKFDKDLIELVRRFFRPPEPAHDDHADPSAPPKPDLPEPGLERLVGPMRRALEGGAGAFAQNVGFALPVEEVAKAVERVKRSAGKPWLGVDVIALDEEDRKDLGIEDERGIVIVGVRAGSPAAKAGLKTNDVVLSWNATAVVDTRDLRKIVLATPLGAEVKLEVLRGKQRITLAVKIEGRGH